MGLESPGFVSDLVSSNPIGTDLESQGDDHIRLVKGNLQTTFPNASRAFRFFDTKAAQTTSYSISTSADMHKLIPMDATSGPVTATLPSAPNDGWWCIIVKRDSTANAVTIDPAGSDTINGTSTLVLIKQYEAILVWWDNQASTWSGMFLSHGTPYVAGGQDIPFSDIVPSANAKRLVGAATATDFSEQTIATVLEWLGTAARGDIILRGASSFDLKHLGAANTFLKSDGTDLVYGTPTVPVPAYVAANYIANSALLRIPYDDTIPQIGEGTEIISVSITPVKSDSVIKATFVGFGSVASPSTHLITALFKDSGANAVQVSTFRPAADFEFPIVMEYVFAPGSTSAITLAVRAGADAADTGRMNGTTAARKFGGAASCTLVVQEIFIT